MPRYLKRTTSQLIIKFRKIVTFQLFQVLNTETF